MKADALQAARRRRVVELPARTVCVAAGTSPNVIYETRVPGHLRARRPQAVLPRPRGEGRRATATVSLEPCKPRRGLLHELPAGRPHVSFYGDNHPHYAGSVVKAMASAKDGYPHVVALFPETRTLDPADAAGARRERCARSSRSSTTSSSPTRAPGQPADADHRRDRRARARWRRASSSPGSSTACRTTRRIAPVRRRHAAGDGGARADRRLGRSREGPARHDRARDGRQLAALRGARARASRSS